MIKKEGNKYSVWSEDGKKRLGKPGSKAQAVKRLRQVEFFKHHPEKSYSAFIKKAVPEKKLRQHVKEDGKKFDEIESSASKIASTAKELKEHDKKDFKKGSKASMSASSDIKKSTVTDHIHENTTVKTKELCMSLGLDYHKFMGFVD